MQPFFSSRVELDKGLSLRDLSCTGLAKNHDQDQFRYWINSDTVLAAQAF
jgi:hypothetical protein